MHILPRLAVATAASLSLTVALAAQPAYAAHRHSTRSASHPTLPRTGPAPRLASAQARAILIRAAHNHGLNPNFVLAVSYWESAWDQIARSYTGPVRLSPAQPYS